MVDKNKTYSLHSLMKLKAFPKVGKSFSAYRYAVMRDQMGKNILQAQIMGEGMATRIYIQGINVLKYQEIYKK